jgi:hypothetical protein
VTAYALAAVAASAIAGLAAIFPALLLFTGGEPKGIDARADVPVVEVALLRSLPIFAGLGAPALERGARFAGPRDRRC